MKKICGYVVIEPIKTLDGMVWAIRSENVLYWIISEEKQAIKDYLFIRDGQKVGIIGYELKKNKNILFLKDANIDIKYLAKLYEAE